MRKCAPWSSVGVPVRRAAFLACFAVLSWPAAGTEAQVRVVPDSMEQVQLSFAPVAKAVSPAVVNIYTTRRSNRPRSPFFDDPFLRRFFGFGPAPRRRQHALGSGVIVDAGGLIVTNRHVVEDSDGIRVVLADRREFPAELLMADDRGDLALLRADVGGEALPFARFGDSDAIEVGDPVLAIGNPFGVGQTVTAGIVSAIARTRPTADSSGYFIQTDAAINPGNSGGPLVNLAGEIIGINTAILSRSGGSHGVGFAIPANLVRLTVEGAAEGRRPVRPWLGADGQPLTRDLARSLGLARPGGVLINDIHPDGPFARAGGREGDVVMSVAGHDVHDEVALRFRMATLRSGTTASLAVWRRGETHALELAVELPPEMPPREAVRLTGAHPLSGAEIINLSPAVMEEWNHRGPSEGVLINDVPRGSSARSAGFREGDLLRRIDDTEVRSTDEVQPALDTGRPWRITVWRRGRLLTSVFR